MHLEFLIGWCDVAPLFVAACFLRRRLAVTHDFTTASTQGTVGAGDSDDDDDDDEDVIV